MTDGTDTTSHHRNPLDGDAKRLTLFAGLSESGVPLHVSTGVDRESHPYFSIQYGSVNGPRMNRGVCVFLDGESALVRFSMNGSRDFVEPWHSDTPSVGNNALTKKVIKSITDLAMKHCDDVEEGVARTDGMWSQQDLSSLSLFFRNELHVPVSLRIHIQAAGSDKTAAHVRD